MQVEAKIEELGLTLPTPGTPMGNYVPGVRTGNLVFLSGVGPGQPGGQQWSGKVGRDYTTEEAYQAARGCALNLLGNLKSVIGDLDKVTRVVKVLGMVNADPEFTSPPAVINGCSDLLVEVFGEHGRHARSAVGMAALPNAIPVEIEMIVEVEG